MITKHATQEHREHSKIATANRLLVRNFPDEPGSVWIEWGIPAIYRMTAAQFERWLIARFGPQYLEPVNYRRTAEGTLVPEEDA